MNGRRIAVTVLAALAGAVLTVTPAHAAGGAVKGGGIDLKAGKHHPISRTLHAGYWRIDGRDVLCVSYGEATGQGPLRQGAPLGMADAESRARAAVVVNADSTWLTTNGIPASVAGSTRDMAAVRWFALAELIVTGPKQSTAAARGEAANLAADLPRYLDQLNPQDQAAVATLVVKSKVHGRYQVALTLPKTAPGTPGTAVVTVTGSNGQPAAGLRVTAKASGGTITPGGITDRFGRLSLTVTPSALSMPVSVTVSGPSSTVVWETPVAAHRQSMIGGGFTESATASGCLASCPVSVDVTVHAKCLDDGKHQVDVTFTVEAIPGNYRGYVTIGSVRSDVAVTPGEVRTVSAQVSAGQAVTVGYQILDGSSGAPLITSVLDSWVQR